MWQVIGTDDNPVWPGWNAADTPLLFYLPNVQEVLINHRRPPPGFVAFNDSPGFDGCDVFVRDGATTFSIDGQNTSIRIQGISTLVVADTLSNRRLNVESLLEAARSGRSAESSYEGLSTSPYDQMAMIAHEAFHVHQDHHAPQKRGNELALLKYPVLSVENNVGFALEAEALFRGLLSEDESAPTRAAAQWLAARRDRRRTLSEESIAYEDGTEFNEGLAKYVEFRLLQELGNYSEVDGLKWAQGYHGLEDLSAERLRLVQSMRRFMRGDAVVNNDPYGTAPARMRLYWSGMGAAVLLDRLNPTWRERMFEDKTTLTSLMEEALPASAEDPTALEVLRAACDYPALVTAKSALLESGRRANEQAVREVLEGTDGTLLVFDHHRLENSALGLSFTPFGIRAIDERRTLFTQVPLRGSFRSGYEFEQKRALPLLQLHDEQRAVFRVPQTIDEESLLQALNRSDLPEDPIENLHLDLADVTIRLRRARIDCHPGRLTFDLY